MVNEDILTLEDFNYETPANEDSTKSISRLRHPESNFGETTLLEQHRGTNQICHKAIEKMLRNKSLDKGKSRTHQN